MSAEGKQIRLCNCNKTMQVEAGKLAGALKLGIPLQVHAQLCRRDIGAYESALKSCAGPGNDVVVACTQEAPLFDEIAAGERSGVRFVNIREQAGWSAEGQPATAKIAGILAAALLPDPDPVPRISYESQGRLLIVGEAGVALGWAERLADALDVAVLISDRAGPAELPVQRRYPVYSGKVSRIEGYLGAFQIAWEQTNPIDLEVCVRCNACIRACPEQAIDYSYQIDLDRCRAHRQCVASCGDVGAIDFSRSDTVRSDTFDLVLDLSNSPLFPMPQPPQGYFAPGRDPLDQALAVNELSQMVGEFEKPKYFHYRPNVCAHGRNEITGCTRCLDVCSTQAISADGDHVKVEPHLCMGCGGCATVCPSGAMGYTYPRVADMGARIRAMLKAYRDAGGERGILLFHNVTEGREAIARLGRRGKGLPVNVIPVETFHVGAVGLDVLLGCVALGAEQVAVLSTGCEAEGYMAALKEQMALGDTILNGLGYPGRHYSLVEAGDLPVLESALWSLGTAEGCKPATFNLFNDKRATLDFAIEHLAKNSPSHPDEIPLPSGSLYGAVVVDKDACTMCLACVGSCPEKALLDSKELPQLKFIEKNCVQCGLCEKTCPEHAISLQPRLLLTPEVRTERVLNRAEVFCCVRCGKPFATRQMIDSMVQRLTDHSMFGNPGALDRIRMCADCRVVDMMEQASGGTIFDFTR